MSMKTRFNGVLVWLTVLITDADNLVRVQNIKIVFGLVAIK